MIPMMSKVIEFKLNGSNHYSWRSNVHHFIRSIAMDEHIKENPPIDATKKFWWRDDSRMLLQIKNSTDHEIIVLINKLRISQRTTRIFGFSLSRERKH